MNAVTSAVALGTGSLSRGGKVAYAGAMNTSPDDSALMLRYKDGDIAAFETLYKRHNDSLYRYLLRLSRNTATAEDLYQEVWSKIIKTRERYRPTAKFTTFLYRVAHNAFVDYVRRNKRYAGSAEVPIDAIEDTAQSLDDATETSLAREKMKCALLSLPDEQRDTFLLHEEAGLTLDDIAHVTGSNRETAKSRLRYATNKLRAALAESPPTPTHLPQKRRNES